MLRPSSKSNGQPVFGTLAFLQEADHCFRSYAFQANTNIGSRLARDLAIVPLGLPESSRVLLEPALKIDNAISSTSEMKWRCR